MQKGVDKLGGIERLERMKEHLDPDYFKAEVDQLASEYAEIMKELVAGCLKDSGMVLKEIPENKLAAII